MLNDQALVYELTGGRAEGFSKILHYTATHAVDNINQQSFHSEFLKTLVHKYHEIPTS